eukprot:12432776-Prorocentrum_lima.AAC.1
MATAQAVYARVPTVLAVVVDCPVNGSRCFCRFKDARPRTPGWISRSSSRRRGGVQKGGQGS